MLLLSAVASDFSLFASGSIVVGDSTAAAAVFESPFKDAIVVRFLVTSEGEK